MPEEGVLGKWLRTSGWEGKKDMGIASKMRQDIYAKSFKLVLKTKQSKRIRFTMLVTWHITVVPGWKIALKRSRLHAKVWLSPGKALCHHLCYNLSELLFSWNNIDIRIIKWRTSSALSDADNSQLKNISKFSLSCSGKQLTVLVANKLQILSES